MVIARKPSLASLHPPPEPVTSRVRAGAEFPADGPPAKVVRTTGSDAQVDRVLRDPVPDDALLLSAMPHDTSATPIFADVLERYRLKPPANLPPADPDGIMRIANRQFVRIADDVIVQIRRDGTSGMYRATRASERSASGPVLVPDRRTLLWGLLESDPLSEAGKEPAVVIPVKAHEALYEGHGDGFEKRTTARAVIVARGLGEFSPEHAAIVRSELKAVEQVFTDAANALALNYREVAGILQQYFGSAEPGVAAKFAAVLSRAQGLSREYQGPWGEGKFVAIDAADNNRAWVNRADFHGRIFVNVQFLQAGVGAVFGHEMLHLNRINRFTGVGANAADFFYLDPGGGRYLGKPVGVFDIAEQGISEAIMRGGLTVEYLRAFTDDHRYLIAGVQEHLALKKQIDVRTAVDLFNASPLLRAEMALRNADSLVWAATSLQRLHHARMADSQLLNELMGT
ncbi:hypothetical protein [Pseudomonas sp. HMWF021]|uniref:hypothetical protein n=1 Tax=Pseudomonas sp. HMWF021 TaxID=2056857 RepID=UPI000D3C39BE|nr:hypothetical protein [Pseudomonas sp. HMWF021]PTT32374.1 hypothetical protein DBR18_04005 [Pseudomonas sp. HMWF021]